MLIWENPKYMEYEIIRERESGYYDVGINLIVKGHYDINKYEQH